MQDWQAQQRALKEAERQSKTQAAELLHAHQNTTVQSSTLKQLKDQDRLDKLRAQQELHQYRASFVSDGRPLKAGEKLSYPDGMVEREGEAMSGISVLEAVASYQSHAAEGEPSFVTLPDGTQSSSLTDSAVMVSSGASPSSSDEWIKVATGDHGLPVDDDNDEQQERQQSDAITVKHENYNDTASQDDDVFVDVEFRFCLVSHKAEPPLESYLQAVSFVIGTSVAGSATVQSVQTQVESDTKFRHDIQAVVPVLLPHHSEEGAKRHVWSLLKAAVNDGSLEQLAASYSQAY
jgi:hypothetical protein